MSLADELPWIVLKSRLPRVGTRRAVRLAGVGEIDRAVAKRERDREKHSRWRARSGYHEKNRERLAAYNRAWRAANPDKVKATRKRWREANRQKYRAIQRVQARKRYSRLAEHLRAEQARYRKAHPERVAASKRKSYQRNREDIMRRQRAWYALNRDRINAARRAKTRSKNA